MSRSASPSIWSHLHPALLLAAIACLAMTSPAGARIGNPLKKAKEKAEQTVTPATPAPVGDDTVVFDDVTLELNEERVTRIVKAFNAAATAGAGRPAAVEKLNKLNEERGELWDKHGESIMDVQRKRGDMEGCYHDGYEEVMQQRTAEYQQRALTDPALREKFSKAAQEYNAAAAQGDSVALARLNAVLAAEVLPTSADSAAVRKKCGPLPPISGPEAKMTALDKEIAAQTEQLRQIDQKIAESQAKELQMKDDQFATALERIRNYIAWSGSQKSKSASPPVARGFTEEELDALEKHVAELKGWLAY